MNYNPAHIKTAVRYLIENQFADDDDFLEMCSIAASVKNTLWLIDFYKKPDDVEKNENRLCELMTKLTLLYSKPQFKE